MTAVMTQKTRTRFAPSPTGFIHLGNIRSALYPWAFARATGGDFILRIEPADFARMERGAEYSLAWDGKDQALRWSIAKGVAITRPKR